MVLTSTTYNKGFLCTSELHKMVAPTLNIFCPLFSCSVLFKCDCGLKLEIISWHLTSQCVSVKYYVRGALAVSTLWMWPLF